MSPGDAALTQRLLGNRTLAEHVFDHSPDLIKVLDADGRVLYTNDADVRHPTDAGCIREGMLWPECWPSETTETVMRAVEEAVLGQRTRFSAHRTTSTGERRWFDVLVSPLGNKPGAPPLVLAVSRDVTERHQLEDELRAAKEEAESSARARADFVATMSHELRTPLAGIISHLELFNLRALPSRDAQRVKQLQEATDGLLRIVNDAFDIARIEADGLPIVEQPFDVTSLVEDVVSLISPIAEQKGLRLTHRLDEHQSTRLCGDAGRLRQVLLNLMGNAVKFTAAGRINLDVRTRAGRDGHVRLRLAVADTGIGISDDTRDLLYKRFAQLGPSIKRRYGGTGLGLAISRHIVERMGGSIGVDSVPGEGTTFVIELDLKAVDFPSCEPQEGGGLGITPIDAARFDLSILVVDDNALHREVTSELLKTMGCTVECAIDGLDAVDVIKHTPFDIVFLDQQMPGLSGVETARLIRASCTIGARPRLIACTANVFGVIGDEDSFDECLIKPLTRRNLSPVLGRTVPVDVEANDDRLFRLLPPDTAAALLEGFRFDLQELERKIAGTSATEIASLAHKLISSARILGLDALALTLQRAEAALLGSQVWPIGMADEVRQRIGMALANCKSMDPVDG